MADRISDFLKFWSQKCKGLHVHGNAKVYMYMEE